MPKKLRTFHLAAIIFLTVSGGPYGLEPLLSYAGDHAAFLLLLITPMLWDLPTIAVVLELNSMMPVNGGYYFWVKRALGLRWAFFEGWWTWLYTFVDLAIYPVLFVQYAAFFYPEIVAYKIPVCLGIIWLSALLNIKGVVPVGKVSLLLSIVVLIPFIILFGSVLLHHHHVPIPRQTLKNTSFSSVGFAIYTIMWNFIGWDNTTTYAQEVHNPVKAYLKSVSIAFILILGVYFLAMYAALQTGISHEVLQKEGFPAVGFLAGGSWLAALLAAGGMASTLGLYSGVLLSVSRIPEVMATDNLLPKQLNKLHPTFNTPYISIITCSAVVSLMVLLTFESLIIIDVTVYGAALFLEYIALMRLRQIAPNDVRPFKVPLGIPGLLVMTLFPLAVYGIAIVAAFISDGHSLLPVLFSVVALASGELIWQLVKRFRNVSLH